MEVDSTPIDVGAGLNTKVYRSQSWLMRLVKNVVSVKLQNMLILNYFY